MTGFDYILLGFAFLHFIRVMYEIYNLPSYANWTLKPICNIWWVFPLIVAYRLWG